MESRIELLKDIIKGYDSLAIAFSGGVDSAMLLITAHEILADKVLALTAKSPIYTKKELYDAQKFCAKYGINHSIISFELNELGGVRENGPARCYHCKKSIFHKLMEVAASKGFMCLAEGTNADDMMDYRPGLLALEELGIKSPLREAGLNKDEIRHELKKKGIDIWSKPDLSCLATRIPTGNPVTLEKLMAVETAEEALKELGFRRIRVRHHGEVGRIESDLDEIKDFFKPEMREKAAGVVMDAGFRYVAVDLLGYRRGSMNEENERGGSQWKNTI